MKKKLIISLFSLFAVARMHGEVNPPTNHVCYFPSVTVTNHIDSPTIGAWVSAGGPYVLTGTNFVDVAIAGGVGAITNGEHEIVTTFEPCECGETNAPYSSIYPVSPDTYTYEWNCATTNDSGPGASFSDTVRLYDPGEYSLSAAFDGYRADCSACACSASASTNFIVYKLTVECDPLYIGLDRTDDGTNRMGKGRGTISPAPDEVSFKWTHGGVCYLSNQVDSASESTIEYWTKNKEDCSQSYMDQTLTFSASGEDPYFSGSATTNFTVVKVDVTLDGVGEEEEETVGALFEYIPDYKPDALTTTTIWTERGTNELKSVSIKCWPENLPTQEMVTVTAPEEYLFEKIGDEYVPAKSSYRACEVGDKQFYFHAHATSGGLRDGAIEVAHETSGAIDLAKFTVFDVRAKDDDYLGSSMFFWFERVGLCGANFELKPNPLPQMSPRWEVSGLPTTNTEITWEPASLAHLGHPEIGAGVAPTLYVKYNGNIYDSEDKSPPDNRWFGVKSISVSIGEVFSIVRTPVFGFMGAPGSETKLNEQGRSVAFWYYYYVKDEAVLNLNEFEYHAVLDRDVAAIWSPPANFKIAEKAQLTVSKAVIVNGYFSEEAYDDFKGNGCHAVAKTCAHERCHKLMYDRLEEGEPDGDGDGLPDIYESVYGLDEDNPDSVHFLEYCALQSPKWEGYDDYPDEDVFCRLFETDDFVKGVESEDWASSGRQIKKIISNWNN